MRLRQLNGKALGGPRSSQYSQHCGMIEHHHDDRRHAFGMP
jgi:hypothetical protein